MTELCPTCNRPLPRGPKRVEFTQQEFQFVRQMRGEGKTWQEIAEVFKVGPQTVVQRSERAAEKFGVAWEELATGSFAGRNDASDYVKIKELRVDAGLPWRLVGEMMGGQSAAWAQARWQGLQKKFDV